MNRVSLLKLKSASKKSLSSQFRKTAAHILQHSKIQLAQIKDPIEELHQIRLCGKKIRALWQLLNPLLKKSTLQKEKKRLKTLMKDSALYREQDVYLETLHTLLISHSEKSVLEIVSALEKKLLESRAKLSPPKNFLKKIEREIDEGIDLLESIKIEEEDWKFIKKRVIQSYKKMGKLYHSVCKHRTVHYFHEWRKCVKSFIYQLLFLSFNKEAASLKEIAKLLGKLHDLDLLREKIEQIEKTENLSFNTAELYQLIDQRILKLRKETVRKYKSYEKNISCSSFS